MFVEHENWDCAVRNNSRCAASKEAAAPRELEVIGRVMLADASVQVPSASQPPVKSLSTADVRRSMQVVRRGSSPLCQAAAASHQAPQK